jgi:hypothetical protein
MLDFEMTRERWLNLLAEANRNAKEHGLPPLDLDGSDGLKVALVQGPMMIPVANPDGSAYWLLAIDNAAHYADYQKHCEGEGWPYFENELRDRIAE